MFIFIAAPRAPAAPTVTFLQAPGKHPASHPSSWDVVWLSNKGKTHLPEATIAPELSQPPRCITKRQQQLVYYSKSGLT